MIKVIKKIINNFFTTHPHFNHLTTIIDWLLRAAGIWYLLIYLGWIPGFICEWHENNSAAPFINIYSGQDVSLDFDIYGDIAKKRIESTFWQITNGPNNIQTSNKRYPTFPLTEGGIFQVKLTAKVEDGSYIKGKTIFNVLETKPKFITNNQTTNIPLQHTTNEQTKKMASYGVEIYSGSGKWNPIKGTSINGKSALQFQPNQTIPTFSGQVLYRIPGSKNDLSDYGSVYFPNKGE